jgi:hypothetical protein
MIKHLLRRWDLSCQDLQLSLIPPCIYVAPNEDLFGSEANSQTGVVKQVKNEVSGKSKFENEDISANRILLFRDADRDGKASRSSPDP